MKRSLTLGVLLAAFAAFVFGLYRLFELRYETGDIYPEYSSLRADPLGTMALYEGLERLPGISVKRDHSADNQLPREQGITYLHLAASRADWTSMEKELLSEAESFVKAGGRLVITFVPDSFRWIPPPPTTPPPAPGKKKSPQPSEADGRVSPQSEWGFEFTRLPLPQNGSGGYKAETARRQTDLPMPEELAWHSPLVFTNLIAEWQTIYARGTAPVLIQRTFGAGTIVMATDSYFLSNEGLLVDRQPELLAWVVGPARTVLFDEAHLGIVENPGMAALMRKYRLQGVGVVLLVLALLFIWQNATSFPPPFSRRQQPGPLMGKEAAAGFINLLRRNIPPADILRVCFEEWTKSMGQLGGHSIARVDAAQAVFEAESARAKTSRDPVRAYREISAALKDRR